MPDLFDVSRCNLPTIPVLDFDFVDDCTVLPAPPASHDCPDLEIPFAPFEIRPCQGFTFNTKLRQFKPLCNSESGSSFDSDGEFTMTAVTTDNNGQCNTAITARIRIPIICPEFLDSGTVTIYQGTDEEDATILTPSGELNIDQVDNESSDCADPDLNKKCRFIPELVIRLPCPTINADNGVTVTREGCSYQFGFGSLLGSACGLFEISGANISETTTVVTPTLNFQVFRDPELTCTHIVDLDIKLPRTRPYRGTVATDATGCTPTVQVNIADPAGGSLGVFDAKVYQRGCCANKPLFAGNRVWLMYDYQEEGWLIISHEDIIVAPIKLLSHMYQKKANAQFNYFGSPSGSLVVEDPRDEFSNAPADAEGWAICNNPDGSGVWQVLTVQQHAEWIIFQLTADLAATSIAPLGTRLEYHDGMDPGETVQLHNTLQFKGKNGAKGIARRRKYNYGTSYEIENLMCRTAA